ncbi:MAG: 30S ribosomal protein S20 [Acidaminococcaceae bacterium]
MNSLPNIKSSIRSVKTDAERRAKNAPIKAALRNASRKVVAISEAGAQEEAQATLVAATGLLDKAARKGIIHKNAAARKKSRLAKHVNKMA